jgi:hypothetical protein
MGRLTMAGAFISVALGFALAVPVAAQAATSVSTAGITRAAASAGHHSLAPDLNGHGAWIYSGLSYPDTSAGLSACETEGAHVIEADWPTIQNYECLGVYQLWFYYPGGG